MNRKIVSLLIVLIFSLSCISMVFAENDTADDVETSSENTETVDLSNYILPVSISNGKIEFNDGFTGFALDSGKDKITSDDAYSVGGFSNSETENNVKLAIIEAYKQGRENDLAGIVSKIVDGNMDTSDSVIKEVAGSSDRIGDSSVVNIDNTTEATFNFELLKSVSEDKSDCLAYKVSMKTVELPDTIAASDDGDDANSDDKQGEDDKNTDEQKQEDKTTTEDKDKNTDEQKQEDKTTTEDKDKQKDDDKKTAATNTSDNKKDSEPEKNNTTVKETNTTIVKNTTTVIENNTTIVHNNVKEVNNTLAPENNTINNLLKSGNPILILIIVIVVAVIAVVFMRRKE